MNEPLQTTFVDIVRFLQSEGIAFALIGGQASSLRGQARVTADIDIVIATDIPGALSLTTKLSGSSFKPLFDDISEVVERAFILPLRHRTTNIKVDLAIGLTGFERQTIARAEPLEVAGCLVPVATAEDLIIMKALAGRPRDDEDILGITIAQGALLDWDYCEVTAAELGEAIGVDLAARIRTFRGH